MLKSKDQWVTLRSHEDDPRHFIVEVDGQELINTYFADGPIYHSSRIVPQPTVAESVE